MALDSPSEWLVAGHEIGEEKAGDVSKSFVEKNGFSVCVYYVCDRVGELCEREKDFDKCEGGK